MSLIPPRSKADAPPGSDAPALAPAYLPSFLKRQPIAQHIPEVAPGTVIGYDRGTLAEPNPGQVLPPKNSEYSRLFKGPIRNFYVRDWYWRGMWGNTMQDNVFPNAHVPIVFLPKTDGRIEGLPGGTAMTPYNRLTFTLSTPAWQVEPEIVPAQSTANA